MEEAGVVGEAGEGGRGQEAGGGEQRRPVVVMSGVSTTFPLARAMGGTVRQPGEFNVAVVHPEAAQQLAMLEVPVAPLQRWADEHVKEVAASEAALLTAGLPERMARIDEAAFGIAPYALRMWLPGHTAASVKRQVTQFVALERLAEEVGVQAVVVHEDVTETFKALCQWARRRGLPAVHVPHATYHDVNRGPMGWDPHDEVTATHVCTSGRFQAEWYRARGAEEVIVTGSPLWDRWAVLSRQADRAWARRALHLDTGKTAAVYFSSWHQQTTIHGEGETIGQAAEQAIRALGMGGEVELVVKVHPNAAAQDEEQHRALAARLGARCGVTRMYLDILLQAADVCVSFGPSNALAEGVLMDVPGVTVGPAGGFARTRCVANVELGDVEGLAAVVREMAGARERAWWRDARRRFIKDFAYRNDGEATARVVDVIRRLTM